MSTITFSSSKNELFSLDDYKVCFRKLYDKGFTIAVNKKSICIESLLKSTVFVLFGPREELQISEITRLRSYIDHGGKLLIAENSGKSHANINLLLNTFGIEFRNDSVIRMHRYKNYHHPCEAFIPDSVVNRSIYSLHGDASTRTSFPILYPYGCTLDAKKSSIILMSTGDGSFPFNRPICAFYNDMKSNGRVVAIGSTMMFSDTYIRKEQNFRLFQVLEKLLTDENVHLDVFDAQCPDIADYAVIPCTDALSTLPVSYLQGTDDVPTDFNLLLKNKLYQFDNRMLIKVLQAYKDLNIEHKTLKIIKPKFISPLPSIIPAIVPPRFRDITHPPLELLDLDEYFMSPPSRLSRLTFKCSNDDLEYYIKECGNIIGIQKENAKCILYTVCYELSFFRKSRFVF